MRLPEFDKLLYLSLMGGWDHPLDAESATALLEDLDEVIAHG